MIFEKFQNRMSEIIANDESFQERAKAQMKLLSEFKPELELEYKTHILGNELQEALFQTVKETILESQVLIQDSESIVTFEQFYSDFGELMKKSLKQGEKNIKFNKGGNK